MEYELLKRVEFGPRDEDVRDVGDVVELSETAAEALLAEGAISPVDADPSEDPDGGSDELAAAEFAVLLGALDETQLFDAAREIAADEALQDQLDKLLEKLDGETHAITTGMPGERADVIREAARTLIASGDEKNLSKSGEPTVAALKDATGLADITSAERDAAVEALKVKEPGTGSE